MSDEHILINLNDFYHKLILVELYREYFTKWINQGFVKTTIPDNLSRQDAQRINKNDLLAILLQLYTDKEVFQKIYPTLPTGVQKAFFETAWYGSANVVALEKESHTTIVSRDSRIAMPEAFHVLDISYRFFQYKGKFREYIHYGETDKPLSGTISLPTEIKKIIREFLPKPEAYTAKTIDKPQTKYTIDEEQEILSQVELYYTYVREGNVERNTRTGLPSAAALKRMQSYCQITEWFPIKSCQYYKTSCIEAFLSDYDKNMSNAEEQLFQDPAELVKNLLEKIFDDASLFWELSKMLLPHIKGIATYGYKREYLGETIKMMLLALPLDGWMNINAYLSYLALHDISPSLKSPWSYSDMYVSEPSEYGYINKKSLHGMGYEEYFFVPFVKAIFFVLASYGIVSLAYNEASARKELDKKPLVPTDGLKAVKITELGLYCLGKREKYEIDNVKQETTPVFLDEHALIATFNGDNKLTLLALDQIGTRTHDNQYQISYASLFKDCSASEDIKRKRELFNQKISQNPPKNWQAFFDQALKQIKPFKKEPKYIVLQLKNDPGLLRFVATDEVIRSKVSKTEGYKIILDENDFKTVKNRFIQAGYFCDSES